MLEKRIRGQSRDENNTFGAKIFVGARAGHEGKKEGEEDAGSGYDRRDQSQLFVQEFILGWVEIISHDRLESGFCVGDGVRLMFRRQPVLPPVP